MDATPNLDLPYIMGAQAQKHVTHNEAIRKLDALVQLAVLDRDLTAPPTSPANGDRYIVASDAVDGWSGHDFKIAAFQDGAWTFYAPAEGWLAWVADEHAVVAWDGSEWVEAISAASIDPALLVGINTTADTTNRLAVKSDAVLFSHDDVTPGTGDQRTVLNKAAEANTASFLFQSNWSGRAEIGLTGNDDFSFKVSPDGAEWYEALVLKKDGSAIVAGVPLRHAKPPSGVSEILAGDEGIALDFRTRESLINDYADELTASGRPSDVSTLTRASDATYVDRDRKLATAGSNALRFTHDPMTGERRGLLMEGAATNLLTYSEDMSNAAWTKNALLAFGSGSTLNAIAAPDGTTTADFLCPNTTNTQHFLRRLGVSMTAGTPYTFSIWVKPGGYRRVGISIYANGFASGAWTTVDVSDGSSNGVSLPGGGFTDGSYRFTEFPGGWKRLEITATPGTTATDYILTAALVNDAGAGVHAGDGTSGMYVWGAQLEAAGSATSYIPTASATASRAADSLAIGPDTFPVSSSGAATLCWRGRLRGMQYTGGPGAPLRAYDSSNDEAINLREGAVVGGIDVSVRDGATTVVDTDAKEITLGDTVSFALSLRVNDFKFYANGASFAADTSLSLPTIDRLLISPVAGSIYEIDEIAYIARARSADELAALSAV